MKCICCGEEKQQLNGNNVCPECQERLDEYRNNENMAESKKNKDADYEETERQEHTENTVTVETVVKAAKTPNDTYVYKGQTYICERSLRWLSFYIKIRLPLGIFFTAINFLSLLTEYNKNPEAYNIYGLVFDFIVRAGVVSLVILTFITIRNLSRIGYKINNTLLIFNIVTSLIYIVIFATVGFSDVSSYTNTFIVIVIDMCNLIYFYKRRAIFVN